MIDIGDRRTVEDWLLIHCHAKTVRRMLPDNWKVPRWFTWHYRPVMLKQARDLNGLFWGLLYESEVLMNLFGLEVSPKQASRYRHPPGAEYFDGCSNGLEAEILEPTDTEAYPPQVSAGVLLSEATRNLLDAELIRLQPAHPHADRISLTDKGVSRAAAM